jgi:hypothetical protein
VNEQWANAAAPDSFTGFHIIDIGPEDQVPTSGSPGRHSRPQCRKGVAPAQHSVSLRHNGRSHLR